MMRLIGILLAIFTLALPSALAQQDVKGTRDHMEIGRFAGSVILRGDYRNFDERQILKARLGDNETTPPPANSITRSGAVTSIVYEGPKTASSLEIAANYRTRLEALGYAPLYICANSSCPGFGNVNYVIRHTFGTDILGMWGFRGGYQRNPRYLVYEKTHSGVRSTAAILIGEAGIAGDAPRYALLVVDEAALKTDQITIPTPQTIRNAFSEKGSISLYGIYFDTGASAIKPQSAPTLQAIADLMKQQPALSLIVVGHTDNVGTFAANIALSQARAAAVVAALTKDYSIAASRLTPFGAGMAAPAMPNATEAGRAKNRRVELVPK